MFSTVFFLFYLPSASIQLQTGLNLSEVLGLSPSQLLACLLAFWAELSLFYGLLWVIHQLLPYSSVNLFYLVKSSLIFFFCIPFTFAVILEGSWENLPVNTSVRPRWVMSRIILATWICLSSYTCTSLMSPAQTPGTLGDTITLIM